MQLVKMQLNSHQKNKKNREQKHILHLNNIAL